jgi:hypothetical protein
MVLPLKTRTTGECFIEGVRGKSLFAVFNATEVDDCTSIVSDHKGWHKWIPLLKFLLVNSKLGKLKIKLMIIEFPMGLPSL